jgi:hypothetical protein
VHAPGPSQKCFYPWERQEQPCSCWTTYLRPGCNVTPGVVSATAVSECADAAPPASLGNDRTMPPCDRTGRSALCVVREGSGAPKAAALRRLVNTARSVRRRSRRRRCRVRAQCRSTASYYGLRRRLAGVLIVVCGLRRRRRLGRACCLGRGRSSRAAYAVDQRAPCVLGRADQLLKRLIRHRVPCRRRLHGADRCRPGELSVA